MNDNYPYQQIVAVLEKIYSQDGIVNLINLSGGIVPYLISNTDSGRNHGDIDFIVKKDNMLLIRQMLQENNLYNIELDSLNIQRDDNEDYGVDTVIYGVPVGFYPYSIENNTIVQRSFTPQYMFGKTELKTRILPGISEKDYITRYQLENGTCINISSLEIIMASKEKAGREKDLSDIKRINQIGFNNEKYQRAKNSIDNSQFTIVEQGRNPGSKNMI